MTGDEARTSFYPLGFFESGQSISGAALLYGDVDSATCVPGGSAVSDVTPAGPYTWRN